MKTTLSAFLCLLSLTISANARLGESVKEIQERYGKPLSNPKPEFAATSAAVYQKNGFQITIGFCEGKSCYEKFQKLDPKQPHSYQEISSTEIEALLKANCEGCNWMARRPVKDSPMDGHVPRQPDGLITHYSYDRSDGNAYASYDNDSAILIIRLLEYERRLEEKEKQRQRENLKGF